MSSPTAPQSLRVYDLVGREIRDADGKKLGRVHDVEAKHREGRLRVTSLIVGTRGWLERFGWTDSPGTKRVYWEDIAEWDPRIVLRRGAGVRERATD